MINLLILYLLVLELLATTLKMGNHAVVPFDWSENGKISIVFFTYVGIPIRTFLILCLILVGTFQLISCFHISFSVMPKPNSTHCFWYI